MDSYSINVLNTNGLNYYTYSFLEKNELSISPNGRLCHLFNGASLETRELAERYLKFIEQRRRKSGDKDFYAEIMLCQSSHPKYTKHIKEHSDIVREKLDKWEGNRVKESGSSQPKTKWIIRIQHTSDKQTYYLKKLNRNATFDIVTTKTLAKEYSQIHFVQKALAKINQSSHFRAISIEVS